MILLGLPRGVIHDARSMRISQEICERSSAVGQEKRLPIRGEPFYEKTLSVCDSAGSGLGDRFAGGLAWLFLGGVGRRSGRGGGRVLARVRCSFIAAAARGAFRPLDHE